MKKNNKKANSKVGKKNKQNEQNEDRQNALDLLDRGNEFGNSLIGMMSMFATNWRGMGIAAIGMAKALATLKKVADEADVNIDGIFWSQLDLWEEELNETTYDEDFL